MRSWAGELGDEADLTGDEGVALGRERRERSALGRERCERLALGEQRGFAGEGCIPLGRQRVLADGGAVAFGQQGGFTGHGSVALGHDGRLALGHGLELGALAGPAADGGVALGHERGLAAGRGLELVAERGLGLAGSGRGARGNLLEAGRERVALVAGLGEGGLQRLVGDGRARAGGLGEQLVEGQLHDGEVVALHLLGAEEQHVPAGLVVVGQERAVEDEPRVVVLRGQIVEQARRERRLSEGAHGAKHRREQRVELLVRA